MMIRPGTEPRDELAGPEEEGEAGRPVADELEYTRFVSQLRVLETRLLTRAQLLRLVEAPDAEAAFRTLAETEYGPAVATAAGPADFETALAAELARVFALLSRNVPDPSLMLVLGLAYDWLNLKTALKAALAGKALEPRHLVPAGQLTREALLAPSGALPEPFAAAAAAAVQAYRTTGDPQEIDLVLDAHRYVSAGRAARAYGYGLAAQLAETAADLVNLRTLLRLRLLRRGAALSRRALVGGGRIEPGRLLAASGLEPEEMATALSGQPGADILAAGVASHRQTSSLALMEKLMDDRLFSLVRSARLAAFGPDPVIAYLLAKELEIRNLRIIFTGKLNRLPEPTIRERLRETYA